MQGEEDLCTQWKTIPEKVNKTQINAKIFQVYRLEGNIVKVSILAKAINRVNEIIRKFKTAFFEEKMKCQNALIEKKHLRNKNQKLTIPYFRIYYKAKLIKICCIWNKDGPAE